MVHTIFFLLFFSLIIDETDFDNYSFSSQFLGYHSRILEKKSCFLLSGQGGLASLHP